LYFDYILADGTSQAISSFGNPIVWWSGIFAALYAFYKAIKRDFVPVFLTIGYVSLLLPWIVTARETQFIYYYYPNVVFLVLMITYAIKEAKIFDKLKHSRRIFAYTFAGMALGLFLLFYPVLAGVPINPDFAERFLLWSFMQDWVLIIY
jgi:dolichyl-phosphate-mannose--protein O-mannosyl transferase